MAIMLKQYPAEVKDRGDHLSLRAACVAIGERLGVSRASLQPWVAQAQAQVVPRRREVSPAGAKPGLSSAEANEILCPASIFLARQLVPPRGRCPHRASADHRLRRSNENKRFRGRAGEERSDDVRNVISDCTASWEVPPGLPGRREDPPCLQGRRSHSRPGRSSAHTS